MDHLRLKLEFLGVRGSIPTPAECCLQTGGNTPCLLVQYGSETPLIIDAGTGLRSFGQRASAEGEPFVATILFSHFHWDHIQGLPFFAPIYAPASRLTLVSSCARAELKENLSRQMREPYFPVAFEQISAECSYEQLEEQSGMTIGSLRVTPIELNHPGNATGFRIDSPNGSMVYVSDHEHGNARIDRQIVRKSEGADLMVYDAHFTPEEYIRYAGWGHSTWRDGVQMATEAGVRQYALFHHSPTRTDEELTGIVKHCREMLDGSFAATEQEAILIGQDHRAGQS